MANQKDQLTPTSDLPVEKERQSFRHLLLSNPNYFGNLKASPFKPVKTIISQTTYEELKCVGYNPQLSRLEAVVWIKRPAGYGGGICTSGTPEYIRFYLSYDNGATWLDQGLTSFTAYDVSVQHPLEYAVSLRIEPLKEFCFFNNLPLVRAVLSWNHAPSDPNVAPVWGNVVETRIQIQPFTFHIPFPDFVKAAKINAPVELQSLIDETTLLKLKPAVSLGVAELSQIYAKQDVPPHRFLHKELQQLLSYPELTENLTGATGLFSNLGIDIASVIEELLKMNGNTEFEQLSCIGLDPDSSTSDSLVGTIHIKRPTGYLGGLCTSGSLEYVGFWLDWGDGTWHWAGTTSVRVHDISNVPAPGLNYAVYLPVNLAPHRKPCGEGPVTAKVRAILSWNTPPTGPNYAPVWGNRLETNILVNPGVTASVGDYTPYLQSVCSIATCDIDQNTGFAPGEKPYGGVVNIFGVIPGAPFITSPNPPLYKVSVQQLAGSPPVLIGAPQPVTDSFSITVDEQIFPGIPTSTPQLQTAPSDYFTYRDATASSAGWRNISPPGLLAEWNTAGKTGLWQISIEAKDPVTNNVFAAGSLLCTLDGSTRQSVRITLDNEIPQAHLEITGYKPGGVGPCQTAVNCATFEVGDVICGKYSVSDEHFGSFSLTAEPTADPAAGFTVDSLNTNSRSYPSIPTVGQSGEWTFNTKGLAPCGYTIQLSTGDRTIVSCVTNWENNSNFVGFCLVAKKN